MIFKIVDYMRNNQPYFENFIIRSTYNSDRIEGNTLAFADTYAILFNENFITIPAKPQKFFEAMNHQRRRR